jgi:hypothetical protein
MKMGVRNTKNGFMAKTPMVWNIRDFKVKIKHIQVNQFFANNILVQPTP